MMKKMGIVKQAEVFERMCPFCNKKLGTVEYFKLKTKKLCTCDHCEKTIDRRYVVH